FDLDWLEALDLRLALNAASVELAGIRLGDAALRAALADGVLTVDGLSGTLLGGEFGASGRLAAGNGAELSLAADLVGASVADLLGPVLGAAPLEGTADLGIDVTTTGHSWAGLVRAADGEGLLAVRDGVIHGLDLAAVGETLDTGAEPLEFLAQLRRALS